VRVEAEVPADEIGRRVQEAAGRLGRELRMPGFRKGKVPAPVVIQRVGRDAVVDEAVRGSLGRWYVQAIDAAGIHPVGDPDIDLGDLPKEGQPLTFTVEIGVRPKAQLGDYEGVEVGRREPAVDDEMLQQQLDLLRDQHSRLETSEGAAGEGDVVVMDYVGSIDGEPFEGGEGRDQPVELGSGGLIPGFEAQLTGAKAGDERTIEVTFPEEYPQAEHLAGKPAEFAVTVKEVKAKRRPDDAELAEANGYDDFE
jgi:trigger factor